MNPHPADPRQVFAIALGLGLAPLVPAQDRAQLSVSPPASDNSPAAQRASFEIADGYEVKLFASEKDGIANPVAMRWGPQGRLWVLCTLAYPQAVPVTPSNDKLYILTDHDGDGRADESHVFADCLDMPTGFALGNGGVYLAEGDDLLFLRDTNGDDRADQRELVLTGFGTGDTHQNINSLTWSPGGELFFCQGLHNFSRVETPWGIVRLDEHGVWRLRPLRRQLHAFRGGSGQNPWGVAFGPWGEPFVKGNNTELSELLPVMVPTENRHRPLDIGATRIKAMICEIVDSPALPDDLQGDILIAGYFGRLIDRLAMQPDGSGHRGDLQPPLLRSDHPSFRPVDIQTGPDGALYLADWFNPIIGHYQASLRHPDRDRTHGRIWRLSATGRPTAKATDLTALPTKDLLDRLKTAPLRERERIRITLSHRDREEVLSAVTAWVAALDATDPGHERHLFEALCLHEWQEDVRVELLEGLLAARDPLARAYATRVLGRWHDRLPDPLPALERAVRDSHPRVRLEAVVALGEVPGPKAITVALQVLDQPGDRFLEAALTQCLHATRSQWEEPLLAGHLTFASPRHLARVLPMLRGGRAAEAAHTLLRGSPAPELRDALLAVLALHADPIPASVLERAAESLPILEALGERALPFDGPAGFEPAPFLAGLLRHDSREIRTAALRLAAHWKPPGSLAQVMAAARNSEFSPEVRVTALEALVPFADPSLPAFLRPIASSDRVADVRQAALTSLVRLGPDEECGRIGASLLYAIPEDEDLAGLVSAFLVHQDGPAVLAKALTQKPLDPKLATRLRGALGAAGRYPPGLAAVLDAAPAANAIGIPDHDEAWVRTLAAEVKESGDPKRGSEVYHRDSLACTMCHVIDVCGVEVGPELTAVGAGLPVELLIEAVVWPARQVKEGYLSTTLTTRTGGTVSGFIQNEDAQKVVIRDPTGKQHAVAVADVATRQDAGTIMPPGLTATLTREELRDLVRFLAERKGQALGGTADEG